MRCVVTELLIGEGHVTAVIDNLAIGRKHNLRAVWDHPNFRFLHLDITDTGAMMGAFAGADWVFHLGALADIVPSIRQPLDYHRANVDGTASVLEAARAAKVKRFVYAASSSCYGLPGIFPTPETAPARPMYPYALTKYVAEQYVMHWSQLYDIHAISLRLFNVYGPRARTSGTYGAVFGVFLAQKLAGKPYTVVGDGSQTRDFTYVTDVARAFLMAIQSESAGDIMNVGSGGHYSVNALTRLLGGDVVHIPKRPGEPDCTFADIARIGRCLGWSPKISFDQGVRLMLEDLGDWCDAPVWDAGSIKSATEDWFKYLGKPEG
jgi:UDP-glucose 4-epimerase